MAFRDIAGNERVKRILRLALRRGRVPQSLLFCGPEGTGKLETAVTLAKALNCAAQGDDSCDECPSCRAIDADFEDLRDENELGGGRAPDVIFLVPEKKVLKIEQVRFLKQAAYLRPMTARRRVFIVGDADTMNAESANSILKVLEEPPATSHIVLVAENPTLLPATIHSRCQKLAFAPLRPEEIEGFLLGRGCSAEDAKLSSVLVDGNLGKATSQGLAALHESRAEAWEAFRALLPGGALSGFLERWAGAGGGPDAGDELKTTLELVSSLERDLLLLRDGGDPRLLFNPDREAELREAAAGLDADRILAGLDRAAAALAGLDRNLNRSLVAASLAAGVGRIDPP